MNKGEIEPLLSRTLGDIYTRLFNFYFEFYNVLSGLSTLMNSLNVFLHCTPTVDSTW